MTLIGSRAWASLYRLRHTNTDPRTFSPMVPEVPPKSKKPNRDGWAKCKNRNKKVLAPRPGLEPGTYGLTAGQTHKSLVSRLKNCNRFCVHLVAACQQPNLCRTKPLGIAEIRHRPHAAQRVPSNEGEPFPNTAPKVAAKIGRYRTDPPNRRRNAAYRASEPPR